jgi:Ribonuclease HepT-like
MLSEVDRDALEDILDNIVRLMRFVDGYDLDRFIDDDKTFHSATRCLEIISEASRRLSPVFKARFPEIPWKDASGGASFAFAPPARRAWLSPCASQPGWRCRRARP